MHKQVHRIALALTVFIKFAFSCAESSPWVCFMLTLIVFNFFFFFFFSFSFFQFLLLFGGIGLSFV